MIVSWKQKQIILFVVAAILIAAPVIALFPSSTVSASQITTRSLTLVAQSGNYNGSAVGATVNHLFSYYLPTAGNIESIQFLYCTTADGSCVTPNGLVTTSSTLGTQTGASFTTLNNSTNGAPYVFSTSPVTISSTPEHVTTQLNSIVNPSGTDCSGTAGNCTFFVRITTFTSDNVTTGATDTGNVAASVTQQITLTGTMPESLIFCVGVTVNSSCSSVGTGSISFNQLFSPTSTATATSQMVATTNAFNGYIITVWGTTLTSGANTITAMSSSTTSSIGTGQFGMNLMSNTTPSVGTAINPSPDGVNYTGEPTPSSGYDVANDFKFVSGNQVADSLEGGGPNFSTDAQVYTVSYIANVPGKQISGTYTTTLTYICTPTF